MKRHASSGFTIVESLVVLGVTSALFAAMAVMVSGQQSKARFQSAVTDISSQLQQQINEVATGFYPSNADFTCTAAGSTVAISGAAPGSVPQGTNSACIFLGRAVMLGIPDTDPEEYHVHTLVGLRQIGTLETSSLRQAGTRTLSRGNGYANSGSWPNQFTTKHLQYGAEVAWMRRASDDQRIAGFAIVTSPSGQVGYTAEGVLESGTVIASLLPIPYAGSGSDPGVTSAEGVDLLVRSLGLPTGDGNHIPTVESTIQVCVNSGTTNQSALLTIGGNNSTNSIETEILNTVNCSL